MTEQENMHPEPTPQEASGNPTGLRIQYVSDRFELRKQELMNSGLQEYIDQVEFYTAENVFYLPEECRWTYIMENAKQPNIFCPFRAWIVLVHKTQGDALGWQLNAPSGRGLYWFIKPRVRPWAGSSMPLRGDCPCHKRSRQIKQRRPERPSVC